VAPLALSSRIDMCSDLVGMAVVGMAGFEPAACSQNRSPALLGGARRPDVPFSWDDDCSLALGAAQRWWPLAPNLAPRESVSLANVR